MMQYASSSTTNGYLDYVVEHVNTAQGTIVVLYSRSASNTTSDSTQFNEMLEELEGDLKVMRCPRLWWRKVAEMEAMRRRHPPMPIASQALREARRQDRRPRAPRRGPRRSRKLLGKAHPKNRER